MKLSFRDVRKSILPDSMRIESTESVEILDGVIIGQDRAVESLRFGLTIDGIGFNVYVSGPSGIGKMTSVRAFVEELAHSAARPSDWCYVYNFADPYEPKALGLPAGRGAVFKKDLEQFAARIREDLPRAFESEEYAARKEEQLRELTSSRDTVLTAVNEKAAEMGFSIRMTPIGLMILPIRDGKPLSDEQYAALPEQERQEIEQRREELQAEIKNGQKSIRRIENEIREKLRELDRGVVLAALGGFLDDLREKHRDRAETVAYIDALQEDMLSHTDTLKSGRRDREQNPIEAAFPQRPDELDRVLDRYRVNVVVDNSAGTGAPVVVELNPTYTNLIGKMEKEMRMGALFTDFSLIKAGSLLRANGGYLVLPAEDLIRNFFSWEALKRSLRCREVRIEEPGDQFGFMSIKTLRPEPIPLSVKVILVGRPYLYHLLYELDPEFPELFKVKADYDTRMNRTDENLNGFIMFAATLCRKEGLLHLDRSALELLLEHAARIAEHQERISIGFGAIADVIREANHWARTAGASTIKGAHVRQALTHRINRSNLLQMKLRETIEEGALLIETRGKRVGQVNGLSVLDLGDYRFGRPSRITAVVGPGQAGIVDIEREIKLGGPIHSKGVLVLSGCLAQRYSGGRPLTLSAQLVFEQNYGGIEGDSASQAEFYALVSALSDVPISQEIAVTGSIDQFGNAQAIGGVNEKVEGFFDVCRTAGLTGGQGVIIPESNVKNLMLREDVTEAVKNGEFHLWSVRTVDEGIEILTGETAGERREDGTYPIGTVNRKVADTLRLYSETVRELGDGTMRQRTSE